MEAKSIPRLELIQVAETVSREKSIEKEEVILAMEEAIQKAARTKYGLERDIRANIDRKNGSIDIAQFTEVVENIENELIQMTIQEAELKNLNLNIGDFLIDDRTANGAGQFTGEHIHFGTGKWKDWKSTLDYLIPRA